MLFRRTKATMLAESDDMLPVQGVVEVDVPLEVLWNCFRQAHHWPGWNRCFFWVSNHDLVQGKSLIWCFQPIRWWYPYKMPALARIVEVEEYRKVTWEVIALPGFSARHTYHMEDLGHGRSRFGSWEQATGWSFRLTKAFWLAHFRFVKDRSLEGAKRLEALYARNQDLQPSHLPRKAYWPFWLSLLLLPLLPLSVALLVFYLAYLRQKAVKLAPGVHAVFGGGGNSLIVQDEQDVLLVDTKFPPASGWLKKWIAHQLGAPVTKIVNTHYHYDHTHGNSLYPGTEIITYKDVPAFLIQQDAEWWKAHQHGFPNVLVGDGAHHLKVGKQEVVLTHPDVAHTHGDLWVHLPEKDIIATGDLLVHTYYSFFDQTTAGVVIPRLIKVIRDLARDHPTALFVPGHGPLANAQALSRYADYLESLYRSVECLYTCGLTEKEVMRRIHLKSWGLTPLPSFYHRKLIWATARSNIRWVYQIIQRLLR